MDRPKLHTGIKDVTGTAIRSWDIVKSTAGTFFAVILSGPVFVLSRPEGIYDLDSSISDELIICGDAAKDPGLTPWLPLTINTSI